MHYLLCIGTTENSAEAILHVSFSYYAYKLNNGGRSAQYRPKSFIMTGCQCLRRFQ